MSKSSLYPKLAFINIKNNRKFYLPYMLTGMGVTMMFYVMLFLTYNPGLEGSFGGRTVISMLMMGCYIIAIFSAVVLFYTNSFLIKRRKMELGLFVVLGMEKRHLGLVQFFETLYAAVVSIAVGLLLGIGFSRLTLMLLVKLTHVRTSLVFSVDMKALVLTAAFFAAVYFVIFIFNLIAVGRAKPIELLQGGKVGEKEPKTKVLLTILGVLCLGGGYAIALLVENPITAVLLFFVAVLLVIAGTYLLFTTGSIAVLKALKNNKSYYYKTRHFIGVSGMIYRMKQNAAGLSNICILSTMVLVMLSTTVSLNVATEDILAVRCPADVTVHFFDADEDVLSNAMEKTRKLAEEKGVELTGLDYSIHLSITTPYENGAFVPFPNGEIDDDTASAVTVITDKEYTRRTGNNPAISDGEALTYSSGFKLPEEFDLLGLTLKNAGQVKDFPIKNENEIYVDYARLVITEADYDRLAEMLHGSDGGIYIDENWWLLIDAELSEDEQPSFGLAVTNELNEPTTEEYIDEDGQTQTYEMDSVYVNFRSDEAEDFYSMYGGLLFLGICLGIMFIMATILIIYYKQITEGYNDRDRFIIMRKVGLSDEEIRRTIRMQILTVFFLPLLAAVVHVCFAFSIITKLLAVLNMTNVGLYAICTAVTIGVFALLYLIVFSATAKEYYKIIS